MDMWELQEKLFTVFEPRVTLQYACQVHSENVYELAQYFGCAGYSTAVSYDTALSLRIWKPGDGDTNEVDVTIATGEVLLIDRYHCPAMAVSHADFSQSWQRSDHEQRIRKLEKILADLS